MSKAMLVHKDYKDLPVVLNVSHIQAIMGISKASAYALVHSDGFPATQINGKLIKVSKRAFFDWLEKGAKNAPNPDS